MFAKTIIDSDAFLDMPLSTQALYFHLSMRADDEGFINNPKKIQRMIGASDDDMKILTAKSFIIPFESGIVVIKHWKIHNYIRGDRIKNTVYAEERELLEVKDNGAYTIVSDICQTTDGQLTDNCQHRLGKVSIGKDRIDKDSIDYQQIADMYNDTCVSFPRVTTLSEARKKAIKARLKTYTIDDFKRMFEIAEKSYFLKGGNDRNWCANFDWMIKDANMAKILDGNYNNNADIINRPNNYDKLAELERRAMNGM